MSPSSLNSPMTEHCDRICLPKSGDSKDMKSRTNAPFLLGLPTRSALAGRNVVASTDYLLLNLVT